MEFLPLVFYDHLASQLDKPDLREISFRLRDSNLTKLCRVHYEKRGTVCISAAPNKEGDWVLRQLRPRTKAYPRLVDLTNYEYVNRLAVPPLPYGLSDRYPVLWKDSLEKTLRILPQYLRRASFFWYGNENDGKNEAFWNVFYGSNLSRVPFTELTIPYVDHRTKEFLRRQISFSKFDKTFDSSHKPGFCVGMHHRVSRTVSATKWNSSTFSFYITGKQLDLDFELWRTDNNTKKDMTAKDGRRFVVFDVFHPKTTSRKVQFSNRGETVHILESPMINAAFL
uniref:F-box domain-containing protein n=1 Tax=Steinernema glaseri TaxID=37863 RepID=A0A1I7ZT17_9BILA